MKYTKNYNLRLPESNDIFKSNDLATNHNAEAIDRIICEQAQIIAELIDRIAALEAPAEHSVVYVKDN